jgi:hypothetical protein
VYTGSRRRAGSLVTGPKNNGHERRSTRTSGVTTTYRDRIRQRYPEGIDDALINMGSPKPISKGHGERHTVTVVA